MLSFFSFLCRLGSMAVRLAVVTDLGVYFPLCVLSPFLLFIELLSLIVGTNDLEGKVCLSVVAPACCRFLPAPRHPRPDDGALQRLFALIFPPVAAGSYLGS